MMRGRPALALLGLLAASAAAAQLPQPPALAQPTASVRLAALVARIERSDFAREPLRAALRGRAEGLPAFVDPLGDAAAAALEADRRGELAELQSIDRAGLTGQDRILYDVVRYRTEQAVRLFDTGLYDVQRRLALDPRNGPHLRFPEFAGNRALYANLADYERGLARLSGFAGYLRNAVDQLRRGVADGQVQSRAIVRNVIGQVEAILAVPVEQSPFYAAIRAFPESVAPADRTRLAAAYREVIANQVYPGYELWRTYLARDYLPHATEAPGRAAIRRGDALYAAELAARTTTSLTPGQVHATGLAQVARLRREMDSLRREVGFQGDLSAFFEHIRTDRRFYYERPEQLIAHIDAILARIRPALPRLFASQPAMRFEVQPLPPQAGQRGPGFYRQGAPDGSRPGILFINMDMLDSRSIPSLETLILHEGIPGHHFQTSLAQENASLPPLLRFGSFTAYNEGWAHYVESLGPELGLFTDPYQRFGNLNMTMLRAARLVIDTGIHARNWSRQRAIDYLLANSSLTRADVELEVDRAISSPGEVCAYMIGALRMQALRERAARRLGPRFDIRAFHEQMLGSGALPLDVLDAKIDRWLEESV